MSLMSRFWRKHFSGDGDFKVTLRPGESPPNNEMPWEAHRILLSTLNIWTFSSILWVVISLYILVQSSAIEFKDNPETESIFMQGASLPLLYGTIMLNLAALGHLCQHYKIYPYKSSLVDAEHVFIIFVSLLVIFILFELFALILMVAIISAAINTPEEKHHIEKLYSMVFNAYFFVSSQGGSNSIDPAQFWSWIRENCPSSLHRQMCYKPELYSISSCGADISTCSQQLGDGYACPYNICREEVMHFSSLSLLGIVLSTIWFLTIHVFAAVFGYAAIQEIKQDHASESAEPVSDIVHPNRFLFADDSDDEEAVRHSHPPPRRLYIT